MMTPLVSILIPCYNAEPWIGACLESVLQQTWTNREIIVVNDGSKDGSLAVARRFESRGVQIIDQPNRGAAASRNVALRAARGDFIQFLDADDLLHREKIARQLKSIGQTAAAPQFAWCGDWSRFTSRPEAANHVAQPLCADMSAVDWMIVKLEQHRMMHPAAWLLARDLVTRAGPWDETLSLDDDGEYFSRIVLASQGVRCCREAWSYYRSGLSSSLSGAKADRALASAFRSLELSTHRLLAVEDSPRTRRACATALKRFIYEAYPQVPECRRRAHARVDELGGSDLQPEFGPKFKCVARLVGWKLARRLQRAMRRPQPSGQHL